MEKKKSKFNVFPIFITLTIILGVLFISTLFGFIYKTNIHELSCSENELSTLYGAEYCVYLIETKRTFRTDYSVLVSRSGNESYGLYVNYWQDVEDLNHAKENMEVKWARDYVEITSWEGNVMRIYRDDFVGGR